MYGVPFSGNSADLNQTLQNAVCYNVKINLKKKNATQYPPPKKKQKQIIENGLVH